MSDDDRPSRSAALYTMPSEHERQYDFKVRVPLRAHRKYRLDPWIRIVANCETQEVTLAAGIKAVRPDEDDGA